MSGYCPKCGTQNRTNARFCNACGNDLSSSGPRSAQNPASPAYTVGQQSIGSPSNSQAQPSQPSTSTAPHTQTKANASSAHQSLSPTTPAAAQRQVNSAITDFKIIPIANVQGPITITKPKLSAVEARHLIDDWVAKQDQFWPNELTGEALATNLQVFYGAHWIMSGSASGSWSASIGFDRTERITCAKCIGRGTYRDKNMWGDMTDLSCWKCNGKGYDTRTRTDWHSQSGVARGVINQRVVENIASDTEIRCGKRDRSATEYPLSQPYPTDIYVFVPENNDHKAGLALAKDAVLDALQSDANAAASGLGRVRDLRLGYVKVEHLDIRTWLYPIFAGTYEYDSSAHLIEVDGVTGKMHVEVPKRIRNLRTTHWLKIIFIVAIPVIVALVLYNLWASGMLPF